MKVVHTYIYTYVYTYVVINTRHCTGTCYTQWGVRSSSSIERHTRHPEWRLGCSASDTAHLAVVADWPQMTAPSLHNILWVVLHDVCTCIIIHLSCTTCQGYSSLRCIWYLELSSVHTCVYIHVYT